MRSNATPIPTGDRLAGLRPEDLPAPSGVALRIVNACSDPRADAERVAGLVAATPSLAAAILRVVNSAYFGLAREVTSLKQAVAVLGQRSLRQYVLCLAVRDAFSGDALSGCDEAGFWQGSFARAVIARELAEHAGVDPDESFTAGLLLDIGLAALLFTRPEKAGCWDALAVARPDARLELETELFGLTHDAVGSWLAERWGLPVTLSQAIARHHDSFDPGTGARDPVAWVARVSEHAAVACSASATRADLERAAELASSAFAVPADLMLSWLEGLPREVARAASAFGFDLRPMRHPEALLKEVNLALARDQREAQELNWALRRALDERDAFGARLRGELETARRVQRSLLPAVEPGNAGSEAEMQGTFSGLCAPARELSGDFFDYFPLPNGQRAFCVADVAGKGMDAALLMARTSGLFRCLGKIVVDPGRLLDLVNRELASATVRGMFVTMIAGVYDPETGSARIVNAGHPPGILLDAGGRVERVETGGPPLGVLDECRYEPCSVALRGRRLLLFSDGLLEAPDGRGMALGYQGIVGLARDFRNVSLGRLPARLLGRVRQSHDVGHDDVTLLAVQG